MVKRKRHDIEEFGASLLKMFPEDRERENVTDREEQLNMARTVTLQVTDACNLACTYCYQGNKGKHVMPFEIAKELIDKLLSGEGGITRYLNNPPGIILEFIGGEPMLEVELIDKVVDYFRMRTIELDHPWATKYAISFSSNGTLYFDEAVQRFLKKNYGHTSYSVTVDGTKAVHDACRIFPDGKGSYDIAHAAAMDWYKGYDNEMSSKITLSPGNIKMYSDCMKQMVLDGYTTIHSNCVYEDVWTDEHASIAYWQMKEFIDWFHANGYDNEDVSFSYLAISTGRPMSPDDNKNNCGGTGLMLAMDYKGDLYPCLRYMESSIGTEVPPLIIGNVHDGIASKKCEKDCIHCLNGITRRSQSDDECFYCPVAAGCGWCSGLNYQTYGTADKRGKAICMMHKSRSLSCVYYWNSYIKEHPGSFEPQDLFVYPEDAIKIVGKEEYEKLKELTLSVGGEVNEKYKRMYTDKDGNPIGMEAAQ